MNTSISILFIARNPQIVETVLRLINGVEGWTARGCLSNETAMEAFLINEYDLVMFGSGLEPTSELELTRFFKCHKPNIPIIQHYGGGSGLLFGEIKAALALA
jgi:hypothetical protein